MRLSFWEERRGGGGGGGKIRSVWQRKEKYPNSKKPRQLIFNDLQNADSMTQNVRIVLIRHKYVEHLLYKRRSYPCDVTDTAEMVDDFEKLNST